MILIFHIANNTLSLIDNIYTNLYDKNINRGNLLNKISDHFSDILIIKNVFSKRKTQDNNTRYMKIFYENL